MMKRTIIATLLSVLGTGAARADDLAWLDAYNVAWTTPSANSSESMPSMPPRSTLGAARWSSRIRSGPSSTYSHRR